MSRRACKECGAYLRMGNTSDWCALHQPPPPPHKDLPVRTPVRDTWSDEEIIAALRKWTAWAGKVPSSRDWDATPKDGEPDRPVRRSMGRRAPWAEWLQRAGLTPRVNTPPSLQVLDLLPATVWAVADERGATLRAARRSLASLEKRGLVYEHDGTWYRVEAQEEAA